MKRLRWFKKKRVWIPIVAVLFAVLAFSFLHGTRDDATRIAYSDVLGAASSGRLQSVDVNGEFLDVRFIGDATRYTARINLSTDVARGIEDAANHPETTATAGQASPAIRFNSTRHAAWVDWVVLLPGIAAFGVVTYFAVFLAMRRGQNRRTE